MIWSSLWVAFCLLSVSISFLLTAGSLLSRRDRFAAIAVAWLHSVGIGASAAAPVGCMVGSAALVSWLVFIRCTFRQRFDLSASGRATALPFRLILLPSLLFILLSVSLETQRQCEHFPSKLTCRLDPYVRVNGRLGTWQAFI